MIPLELTMVALALPTLEPDLGLGVVGGAWVIDAYMVAFASLVLASGALADRLGRQRVLLVGILLFGATSALCSVADVPWVLLSARAAQGVGAALTMSAGLGVLADRFRGDAPRFRAFGAFTTAIGVGIRVGPLAKGEPLRRCSAGAPRSTSMCPWRCLRCSWFAGGWCLRR